MNDEIKSCDTCGNSKQHNKSNTWCRRVEVCGNLKIEWRPVGSKSELEIVVDEAEEILKDEIERTDYQYRIDNCKQILQTIQALKKDHPEFKV